MIFTPNYGTCPICNKAKGVANHKQCSRILQKYRNEAEWKKTLENQRNHETQATAIKASTSRVRRANYFEGYIK